MLHIITALYRPQYIKDVYKSIPKSKDIIWHVSKSSKTEPIDLSFIDKSDDRVKIYETECSDTESFLKKREVLSKINDGYFCFLDDDTIFYENMYNVYEIFKYEKYIGMIIGGQIWSNGSVRLNPSVPIFSKIDTGNVLCHHSCLKNVLYPLNIEPGKARDFQFWRDIFVYFNYKTILINEPVSIYNFLRKDQCFLYGKTL